MGTFYIRDDGLERDDPGISPKTRIVVNIISSQMMLFMEYIDV